MSLNFSRHNFMLNRLAFTLEFGKAEQFKGDDNELGGLFLITKEMFYQAQNAAGYQSQLQTS